MKNIATCTSIFDRKIEVGHSYVPDYRIKYRAQKFLNKNYRRHSSFSIIFSDQHMLIVIFDDETMKGSKTYLLRWCTLLVWFPISSIYHWSSYLGNASTSEAFEFQRWGGGDYLRGEAEHWQLDVRSKYVVHGTNNLKHSDFISKND